MPRSRRAALAAQDIGEPESMDALDQPRGVVELLVGEPAAIDRVREQAGGEAKIAVVGIHHRDAPAKLIDPCPGAWKVRDLGWMQAVAILVIG